MSRETIRVLLIDDDEDDAILSRELLSDATEATGRSYRVDWVDSYQAGLDAALRGGHDVVLVDYQLLPGSGLELIREARATGCETPFILLTGLGDRATDEKATEVGAFDFLSKGRTDAASLERSIRYCLRHARTLRTLADRTRELERSNLELEQFARAVSHDLRQPLHAIAGYAELLKVRCESNLDARAREMMGKILTGVERMNKMIEDLLGLAKIDPDGESVVDVDSAALVAGVLEDLQTQIEAVDADIATESMPVVHGRAAHLEQLFRNLLGNAIKFVDEAPARVTVRCVEEEDSWHFTVCDNGIGIPDDLREAIFEPFHRGRPANHHEGTGVGLALCNKIVQQHGGRIWVEPAPAKGSCFHFTLERSRESGHPGS